MSQGKIHFPDQVWKWRATKSRLLLENPDCDRFKIRLEDFFGVTPDTLERARWKQTRCCEVTPGKVKEFIVENLLSKKKVEETIIKKHEHSTKRIEARHRSPRYAKA